MPPVLWLGKASAVLVLAGKALLNHHNPEGDKLLIHTTPGTIGHFFLLASLAGFEIMWQRYLAG